MTVVMAPAVCRMTEPIASANSPSTVRYRPAPMTARSTSRPPSDTGTLLCRIDEPMKKHANTTTSATMASRIANTTTLAASMGSRLGTASSEARMTPVEYSVVMSRAPSTQIVSWPSPIPAPRMKPTGFLITLASRAAACGPVQLDTVRKVNSSVNPTVRTTNSSSVQIVERTERILVHSASIRWPKPMRRPAGGSAARVAGAGGAADVIRHAPG